MDECWIMQIKKHDNKGEVWEPLKHMMGLLNFHADSN